MNSGPGHLSAHGILAALQNLTTLQTLALLKKKKKRLNLTFLHPGQLPGNQSCPTCAAGGSQVTNTSLLKPQALSCLHPGYD